MNESNIEIEEVETIFNRLTLTKSKRWAKEFHLKSIGNFIFHYGRLKKKYRREIFEKLFEYVSLIQEIDFIEKNVSKDLFNKYLIPIGIVYQIDLNFSVTLNDNLFYFLIIFCSLVIAFLSVKFKAGFFFFTLYATYFSYRIHKRFRREVYGFRY